jgi:hypothetical protein
MPFDELPSASSLRQAPFDRLRAAASDYPSTALRQAQGSSYGLPFDKLPSTSSLRQAQGSSSGLSDFPPFGKPFDMPFDRLPSTSSLRQAQGSSSGLPFDSPSTSSGQQLRTFGLSDFPPFDRPFDKLPSTGSGQQLRTFGLPALRQALRHALRQAPFDELPSTGSLRQAPFDRLRAAAPVYRLPTTDYRLSPNPYFCGLQGDTASARYHSAFTRPHC